jgi:hypothetical protein
VGRINRFQDSGTQGGLRFNLSGIPDPPTQLNDLAHRKI